MSQSQDQAIADAVATTPDLHLGNFAPFACKKLGATGAIVLLRNPDGTIAMSAHGVNHFSANEMLSVGIHINLGQHDELVRAGAAGTEAKERQQAIDADAANAGNVEA